MTAPFFSIITPTLQRESLIGCCRTIHRQRFSSWQHLIQVDSDEVISDVIDRLSFNNTEISWCGVKHNNYGNTCRHNAWTRAEGDYLIYLDDDNFLADINILGDIHGALIDANLPDWAVFPILRFGHRFYNDPPGLCQSDTANIIVKREIGRWPNIPDYTADGHWVEALKLSHPNYAKFPDFRPIINMPSSGQGK